MCVGIRDQNAISIIHELDSELCSNVLATPEAQQIIKEYLEIDGEK